jgi:hypothetical protein
MTSGSRRNANGVSFKTKGAFPSIVKFSRHSCDTIADQEYTVLDILRHVRLSVLDEEHRSTLLRHAQCQQRAIEAAWKDVTVAYADLRRAYLG